MKSFYSFQSLFQSSYPKLSHKQFLCIFAHILIEISSTQSQLIYTCFHIYFACSFFNRVIKSFSLIPLHLIWHFFNTITNRIYLFQFFHFNGINCCRFLESGTTCAGSYFSLTFTESCLPPNLSLFATQPGKQVAFTCLTISNLVYSVLLPQPVSLAIYTCICTFNFLHHSTQTTAFLASHTGWKLRTWLILLPQNWTRLSKYLEVLRYLL
jgi:hypothetical protein